MRILLLLLFPILFIASAGAQVITDTLTYAHGDTSLKALMVYDRLLKSLRPGIIIFHENQGFSEQISERSQNLAEFGYVVLVADLFGKIEGENSLDDIKQELSEKKGYLRERAMLAYNLLADQKKVEATRIGVIHTRVNMISKI